MGYETERGVEAIVKAVSPDNVRLPVGLKVETVKENRSLLAFVACDRPLKTLISTLDDLLACISVAERSLKSLTDENTEYKYKGLHCKHKL